MLDIKLIRENPDIVKKGIVKKNANPKLVDDFLVIDQKWREFVKKIDDARAKQKDLGEKRKIEEAKGVKTQIQIWEEELKTETNLQRRYNRFVVCTDRCFGS